MANGIGWRQVVEAAGAGAVALDSGVGARCAQHCDALIAKLMQLQEQARQLGNFDGLGTLPSAVAVADKFSRLAVGGEYSMVQALEDHIVEVQAMKDVFLRIEAQYEAADQATADNIGAIESGM
ncbi:hypothetical protein [Rhodococcus gannanensis]|uniref:PE domain-containing protein n=1 Tax=Rhodococcus gannanensis TaxID=1960308 RepID=A0ABW4P123_9NOCA